MTMTILSYEEPPVEKLAKDWGIYNATVSHRGQVLEGQIQGTIVHGLTNDEQVWDTDSFVQAKEVA